MIFFERLHWLNWGMDRKEGKTEDHGLELGVMGKNIKCQELYGSNWLDLEND